MKIVAMFLVFFTTFLSSALLATPTPIPTLFNTGEDAAGNLLVGGNGFVDPHYIIRAGPGGPRSAVTFKHPAYFADGPDSRWISASSFGGFGDGIYLFETTFDLTGFDLLATSITGKCASDNFLFGIALNGVPVFGDCDGFGGFGSPFTITRGLSPGINFLHFLVAESGFGPRMGFRAEFTSETDVLAVPEPASLVCAVGGLMLLLGFRRRRNS